MTQIPESHADILRKRSFAHVATTNADGSPQVTPVWVDYDGEYILINSAAGRKKDRNMRQAAGGDQCRTPTTPIAIWA